DAQRYGQAAGRGARCQSQAAEVHEALRQRAASRPADPEAAEALFSAERNAQSVVNAEAYFRTSYEGSASTWNLRDQAMASTLAALDEHLVTSTGRPARIVVWAHNTHAGDARVTESGEQGELNIGQLMRQRHGARAVLVGFHTYEGTVLAADEWDSPGRVKTVRPALPESYSALFHATGLDRFLVPLRGGGAAVRALSEPRLQRAIGVIYRPDTERQSHYFTARLGQQFDAVIFIDRTTAVTPLP
ncbi:MAG: hypothetical protein JWL60_1239, partial [Gemmatimonadetes bacterium]|nr:hypothetical protein [Gemmatimonadota bacterium]